MKKLKFPKKKISCEYLFYRDLHAIIHDYPVLYHFLSAENDCILQFAGDTIKDAGYGFAVQKDDPLGPEMTSLILSYEQEGFLRLLEKRWMSSKCASAVSSDHVPEVIQWEYFGGLLAILTGGVVLAVLCLLIEFLYRKKHFKYFINPNN